MKFARRFFSRPTVIFGFAVFVAIVAIALAAPFLFARGPLSIVGMPLLPPGSPGLLAGSDVIGRDMAVGLAYEAVKARDNPVLLGIFIVTALLVSLFNLITDIAYSLVDPRVELGR